MATVNLGRVKPVNKGTWSSATTYAIDDFVQYTDNGVLSTYIAVAASTNQAPSTSGTENSTYWKYMSKGTSLAVGNNKIIATDSSGNAVGVTMGTAGQIVQVNSGANGFEFATLNATGRYMGMEVLGSYSGVSKSGHGVTTFDISSSSSGTWTRPAGCNSVMVYVTGGGGGSQTDGNSYRGGSGGGGGTAIKWIENVASTVSWTVGGGGVGLINNEGSQAGGGGTSSFGSYCSGFGGEGGQGGAAAHYGASGGGATGGDINIIGGGGHFNHQVGTDGVGGMSFWTQAGGNHTGNESGHSSRGKMGSGAGLSNSGNSAANVTGGAGLILLHKYS
tara:strand:- start:341 stop:1339 length:999 start_codon:yes stop_codon:yes gene_type:complete